jgi:hypothetical protein
MEITKMMSIIFPKPPLDRLLPMSVVQAVLGSESADFLQ